MSGHSDKTGYALKVERGERPFIYSAEHSDWKAAVLRKDDRAQVASALAWARRFRPTPVRAAA